MAALELLERCGTPHPRRLVRILAEAVAEGPGGAAEAGPFPGVGDTGQRIDRVLDEDPASSVTVARRWILALGRLGDERLVSGGVSARRPPRFAPRVAQGRPAVHRTRPS